MGGGALTHSQMQANLTSAKESRKRAELDAQLLANRIALLRQEEEKARKKIEETRQKAMDVMELRLQNERRFAAKEQFYKQKRESIRAAQCNNADKRAMSKDRRETVRRGVLEQKQVNAKGSRSKSQQHYAQKLEYELSERKTNSLRRKKLKLRRRKQKEKWKKSVWHSWMDSGKTTLPEQVEKRCYVHARNNWLQRWRKRRWN